MRKLGTLCVSAFALGAIATSCGGGSSGRGGTGGGDGGVVPTEPVSIIDIRADVNRNGTVDIDDATEDLNEDTWDATHGAIFLANMDDDSLRCPKGADTAGLSDAKLAECFDAADDAINGEEDLNDMARIRSVPWPDAPDDAIAHITAWVPKIADTDQIHSGLDHVRMFKNNGGTFQLLPAEGLILPQELRAGVEIAIEAKDIVRDTTKWNGYVDVQFDVVGGTVPAGKKFAGKPYPSAKDIVRLRVAPLLFSHHLQAPETTYATSDNSGGSVAFRADLADAAGQAKVPGGLVELNPDDGDQWTQDFFEIGWMSMPAPGGQQHRIDMFVRSVNVQSSNSDTPLRPAGRVVYQNDQFHGKDAAGLTPDYDIKHDGNMDSLNSYGNTETVPPYELNGKKYPMGRLFRGYIDSFHPDPEMQRMLDAQAVQPILKVDTSWLLVGHVDETMSFMKMQNQRGWGVAVNDAGLAKKMLEDLVAAGNGDIDFFVGQKWFTDTNQLVAADISAKEILANTEVMSTSAEAVIEVDNQKEILTKEIGLTDADFVPIAFLHQKAYGYSVAYQPGTVNGISLGDSFGAPKTHGPDVGGKDPFATQLEEAMSKHGITVRWIEDWDLYHRLDGEVHCGSNTKRSLPTNKWWESGL